MVSTRPLISKSFTPFNNPLAAIPRTPIIIGTNVTFIFFNSLARSSYLSFFSVSFNFTLWSAGIAKSTILQVLFIIIIIVIIIIIIIICSSSSSDWSKKCCPFEGLSSFLKFQPLHKPSDLVKRAPITINIRVSSVLHSFFSSQARSKYLSLFLFSLIFTHWSTGIGKSTLCRFSLFLLLITRPDILVGIGDLFASQHLREFCASYSRGWILILLV